MKYCQIVNNFFLLKNLATKRSLYDVYGIDALRSGITDNNRNLVGGYKYGGNGEEIFEKFFGTMNPYELIKYGELMENKNGSMFSSAFGGLYAGEAALKENLTVELECTLEELYNGCIKKLVYERRILNSDGRTTSRKNEERDVEIFKGYDKHTVLTFAGYGHEEAGRKTRKLYLNNY
jgi:DnaJ family protein B protein 13